MSREAFSGGSDCKESTCKFGRPRFDLWVGKTWRRKLRQPSILAWRIIMDREAWLAAARLQRVRYD